MCNCMNDECTYNEPTEDISWHHLDVLDIRVVGPCVLPIYTILAFDELNRWHCLIILK